jgi:hypothetical protein
MIFTIFEAMIKKSAGTDPAGGRERTAFLKWRPVGPDPCRFSPDGSKFSSHYCLK